VYSSKAGLEISGCTLFHLQRGFIKEKNRTAGSQGVWGVLSSLLLQGKSGNRGVLNAPETFKTLTRTGTGGSSNFFSGYKNCCLLGFVDQQVSDRNSISFHGTKIGACLGLLIGKFQIGIQIFFTEQKSVLAWVCYMYNEASTVLSFLLGSQEPEPKG
jgi:hypothetical protein